MRRVAFLVEQNWHRVPGGTARATNRLIEELSAAELAEVIGISGRHREPPVLELPARIEHRTMPMPGRILREVWSRRARPSVDLRTDSCEVFHAPAYLLPESSLPTVVTIHDLAFLHEPGWFTDHGRAFLGRFVERVRATGPHVIVPSMSTRDECLDAGLEPAAITVVPWGVDPSSTTPAGADATRRAHGLPERFVLYVGTREPRKNLGVLAEAMEAHPEVPLVLVGPEGWGAVPVPGARVLGTLPTADVRSLMAAATVFAYPSHREGFGLPVLEALAEGTPTVVTAATATEEVGGEAVVAVDSTVAQPLADAIGSLLADETERERLADLGRARAAQFSWSSTARATAGVYAGLTS